MSCNNWSPDALQQEKPIHQSEPSLPLTATRESLRAATKTQSNQKNFKKPKQNKALILIMNKENTTQNMI